MTYNLPKTQSKKSDSAPVWFSVLTAARCHAMGNGEPHEVGFDWVAGRAVYTNSGAHAEWIPSLDVQVESGHTLAVFWTPNETVYSTEVYLHSERCAA
jgi:hypothetical protein